MSENVTGWAVLKKDMAGTDGSMQTWKSASSMWTTENILDVLLGTALENTPLLKKGGNMKWGECSCILLPDHWAVVIRLLCLSGSLGLGEKSAPWNLRKTTELTGFRKLFVGKALSGAVPAHQAVICSAHSASWAQGEAWEMPSNRKKAYGRNLRLSWLCENIVNAVEEGADKEAYDSW